MASALWQRLMADRAWYAPEPAPVPRLVSLDELTTRAYADGGPKAGKRPRRDAIETLLAGLRYLHVRAACERDGAGSGDFATTAGQTIDGLMYDLSRRSAKPWDRRVGAGLASWPRRQVRVRKYGSAVRKLLDELAGCGLVVWGGELDNNGLWWRLRIRLLDPDGPPVQLEPWMRPSPRLADPPARNDDDNTNGGQRRGEGVEGRPGGRGHRERVPELEALYDLVAGHGHARPRFSGRLRRRIVAAAARYRDHASQRPRGLSEDPWAVLGDLLEQHALHTAGDPFLRALPFFDALTRRMEKAAKNGPENGVAVAASVNCAALRRNQQTAQTASRVDLPSALAPGTGARPLENDGANQTAFAGPGPAENSKGTEGGGAGGSEPFPGLEERVEARRARWEAAKRAGRPREIETVGRARSWGPDAPVPLGLLQATVAALDAQGQWAWVSEAQVERLRRAERRYALYADHRPDGAPPNPAGALVALLEARPAHVRLPLAWAIVQLDMRSKRMRRHARTLDDPGRLTHAQTRGERRRSRQAGQAQAPWRRRGHERERQIDDHVHRLARRLVRRRGLRRPLAGAIADLCERLHHQGVATTPEQLRRRLRDELLALGGPTRLLAEVDGATFGARADRCSSASRGSLVVEDHERLVAHRSWLLRRRAREDDPARRTPTLALAEAQLAWRPPRGQPEAVRSAAGVGAPGVAKTAPLRRPFRPAPGL